MRIPKRKGEEQNNHSHDPFITKQKYNEIQEKINFLKNKHPQLAEEVKRLAELGDFSENAEYQLAKGKLRGLNQKILELENNLNHSQIINSPENNLSVQLGHTVTVLTNNKTKKYQLLGSNETNPSLGIISQNSPIGKALLGKKVGETFFIELRNGQKTIYQIIAID